MTRPYSISEARQRLAALIHSLDMEGPVELRRRAKPVAVLLSMRAYRKLSEPKQSFWEAYKAFRAEYPLDELDIQPETFTEGRDRSAGREVSF